MIFAIFRSIFFCALWQFCFGIIALQFDILQHLYFLNNLSTLLTPFSIYGYFACVLTTKFIVFIDIVHKHWYVLYYFFDKFDCYKSPKEKIINAPKTREKIFEPYCMTLVKNQRLRCRQAPQAKNFLKFDSFPFNFKEIF